jgi:hypothetical protein
LARGYNLIKIMTRRPMIEIHIVMRVPIVHLNRLSTRLSIWLSRLSICSKIPSILATLSSKLTLDTTTAPNGKVGKWEYISILGVISK